MLASFRREWEVYPFLLLFAVWCSLMLRGSLWVDEVTYTSSAESILHGHIFVNLEHPPLAKYFIALGLLVLGDDEVGARAPAILFGLGTLYLTYKCARMLGGRANALLSMILLGMTSGFAAFAVQAMLDMYLSFFAMLLFYMLLRFEKERPDPGGKALRKWNLGFGVVSALLLLTKFYARVLRRRDLRLPSLAILLASLRWRAGSNDRRRTGFTHIHTAAVQAHPRAHPRRQVPVAGFPGHDRGRLPAIPRYARTCWPTTWSAGTQRMSPSDTGSKWEIWRISTRRSGPISTGSTTEGFVYLVALGVVASLMLKKLRSGDLESEHRLYLVYMTVPLVVLSLFTLKFPRYILPVFPLLAIGVFSLLPLQIGKAARWFCDGAGWRMSQKAIAVGSTVAVCLLVLAIPSPIVKTLQEPDIGIDSHFREVSDAVAQFCVEHPGASIEVVSYHSKALEYYLHRDHSQIRNVHVGMLHYGYGSSATLEALKEGRAQLVVDETVNVRYQDTELHAYVRNNALRSVRLGGDLSLFVMRYP